MYFVFIYTIIHRCLLIAHSIMSSVIDLRVLLLS